MVDVENTLLCETVDRVDYSFQVDGHVVSQSDLEVRKRLSGVGRQDASGKETVGRQHSGPGRYTNGYPSRCSWR